MGPNYSFNLNGPVKNPVIKTPLLGGTPQANALNTMKTTTPSLAQAGMGPTLSRPFGQNRNLIGNVTEPRTSAADLHNQLISGLMNTGGTHETTSADGTKSKIVVRPTSLGQNNAGGTTGGGSGWNDRWNNRHRFAIAPTRNTR